MSNDIKKSLRIIERNLVTSDISYEMVKRQQTCVVNATFPPPLTPCHHCGSTAYNESGKLKIIDLLKKISFTLIAKLCHVSSTTVIRVLHSIKNYLPNPYQTEAMMIDRLLSYSEPLKEAYHRFHDMMDAFRSKKNTCHLFNN